MSTNSFFNLSKQEIARNSSGLPEENNSCLISKCRADLKVTLQCLANLRKSTEELKIQTQELDDNNWASKMLDISRLQQEISNKIEKYSDTNLLDKIRNSLKRRRKKRERIKRRNMRLQIEREKSKLNREKLHKICDDWVKQRTEKFAEQKRLKEAAERSEIVLSSVNKRIISAEKYLHLFEMISKLRKIRYRAEQRRDYNEKSFLEKMERLRSVWSDALLSYREEKNKLQSFLNKSSKSIEHQWREVLFGEEFQEKTHNLEAKSLQELIDIRRTWDSYIVPEDCPMGSSIPVGWVTPNETPSEEWKKYLNQ